LKIEKLPFDLLTAPELLQTRVIGIQKFALKKNNICRAPLFNFASPQ
jgi:hypothetical protein